MQRRMVDKSAKVMTDNTTDDEAIGIPICCRGKKRDRRINTRLVGFFNPVSVANR